MLAIVPIACLVLAIKAFAAPAALPGTSVMQARDVQGGPQDEVHFETFTASPELVAKLEAAMNHQQANSSVDTTSTNHLQARDGYVDCEWLNGVSEADLSRVTWDLMINGDAWTELDAGACKAWTYGTAQSFICHASVGWGKQGFGQMQWASWNGAIFNTCRQRLGPGAGGWNVQGQLVVHLGAPAW